MLSLFRWNRTLGLCLTLALSTIVGCGETQSPVSEPSQETTGDGSQYPGKQGDQRKPASKASDLNPAPNHLIQPPDDPRVALVDAFDRELIDTSAAEKEKLSSILRTAGVSEASQVLVFSKTSLQHRLISPRNPRAIYFNDDCYIGHVPGGLIEYSDADPDPEVVAGMFSIDPHQQDLTLKADRSCLSCHDSSRTNGQPGFLIRSVFPNPDGHIITSAGSTVVGHNTPIEKRWGGWYVTGESGTMTHRGNQVTIEQPNGDAYINNKLGSNITDLSPYFNTDRYLQPTSDIVALMVLEHQVQMHNLLTQGSATVRKQIERSKALASHLGEPFTIENSDTLQRVIESNASKIVKHLLFHDEIHLTDPIVGSPDFQQAFRANRKQDVKGRSLKDFDLKTRLFRYRCSYMVYSRAFRNLPGPLQDAVSTKLREVLVGNSDDEAFNHLGSKERHTILQILEETGVL